MQRYFLTEDFDGDEFVLSTDIAHHFMTVLRGKVDSTAEFVLPDRQTLLIAKVIEANGEFTKMQVIKREQVNVELPIETTLILGLAKGDKPELVVQKGTELGAHHFIFVETEWSVVHWGSKAERKIERLQKIAQSAAEQSHRNMIPDIIYVERLQALTLSDSMIKVVAWEESAKQGERANLVQALQAAKTAPAIGFLIGPEGGLSPAELTLLTEHMNFVAAGFGPRILRAETAPFYALSALSYALELENK
ncbi:MAG: 16S rRNA (uracil(1498)-N(3))-methyltransferase [Lactobacillaceae bacterium]|jgi:16S rRNA (uracil1498-N3)-methyltransferase|nr:16S rRNA (uracil(1498)-N(3))-methyltransferase [Lactobacillaceae bacterium]